MGDLDIPMFLHLTAEQRKAAWKDFKPKEDHSTVIKSDPRKPVSFTDAEWERIKEERRQRKEEIAPAPKKSAPPSVDTTGKRWDARKGKWVKDPFADLPAPAPEPKKPPQRKKAKAPVAGFGIPEGTNRDKLAKAMVKRLGEMVTLKEWSKSVYGTENEGPCFNVMVGFIKDLKKRELRYEIIRDKDEKGQVTFGLFELD